MALAVAPFLRLIISHHYLPVLGAASQGKFSSTVTQVKPGLWIDCRARRLRTFPGRPAIHAIEPSVSATGNDKGVKEV